MRALIILAAAMLVSVGANAQDTDWKKIDDALGRTAAVSGDVHHMVSLELI